MGANNEGANVEVLITIVVQHNPQTFPTLSSGYKHKIVD